MAEKILIVEDEKELGEILGEYFKVEGYETILALDGKEGLSLLSRCRPDLVILDIMLPGMDGMAVCRQIRKEQDIPIIMLSAKSGEMDKVICLGIGADDYVTKPFSPLELVARVKAHLRRAVKSGGKDTETGRLVLKKESYTAYVDGQILELTSKEFEMLYFLKNHENQVFSKEQLYESIWGMNEFGDISSVAVYIKRIREKLRAHQMDYIKTVWGVGYKFFAGES